MVEDFHHFCLKLVDDLLRRARWVPAEASQFEGIDLLDAPVLQRPAISGLNFEAGTGQSPKKKPPAPRPHRLTCARRKLYCQHCDQGNVRARPAPRLPARPP